MITVVIVDDEELICRSLKSMIRRINHPAIGDVEYCSDSLSAQKLITEMNPQIVISDIKMPDMNGIQLIESVKDACPCTKFIILSGYNEYEYVRSSFKLGIVDYLLKPVAIDELKNLLDNTIGIIVQEDKQKTLQNCEYGHKEKSGNTHEQPLETYRTVIDKVKDFVEANYHRDINLASAANHVCMNYSYFSKLFKDETGMTFSSYLLKTRMEAARKLLMDPEKKIQDVAREVGYGLDNTQNFTRAFKNYFGSSPTSFRKD